MWKPGGSDKGGLIKAPASFSREMVHSLAGITEAREQIVNYFMSFPLLIKIISKRVIHAGMWTYLRMTVSVLCGEEMKD